MPGKSDGLIVGLSMGTTKTTMIVAERNPRYPDSINIIGFGNAPSRGITKGIITNLQDARQSVMKAYREAQSITGISAERLSNVIVAFNAMEIQSESTHGMVTLGGRESKSVENSDLERVIERAKDNLALRSSMFSLHMIPTSYEIDGRPIDDPLNMNGSQLDMWLQTVAIPMTNIQNVINCVQGGDLRLKISDVVLKPLASSLGAVYDEEMKSGCISICIGGGTTGIVLYRNGRAFRVISIPIGGEHIRNDLSAILHVPFGEAEHLKKRIFTTPPEDLKREGIDVNLATEAIVARVDELFSDYIKDALAECTPQHFPSGIILSGGVSETPGIEFMLEDILQMPVRKVQEPIYAMPPGLDNPAYVSAAGILRYYVLTKNDPYMFMYSDQPLMGLSENSELRRHKEALQTKSRERNRYRYDGGDEDDDGYENGDYIDDDDPYGEYVEGGSEQPDDPTPIKFGAFLGQLAEKVKKLF